MWVHISTYKAHMYSVEKTVLQFVIMLNSKRICFWFLFKDFCCCTLTFSHQTHPLGKNVQLEGTDGLRSPSYKYKYNHTCKYT